MRRASWLLLLLSAAGCRSAQTYDQGYLRARDNWAFRNRYPQADRLINAFDYGHAILAETLIRDPVGGAARLEGPVYLFVTCHVLMSPPHVPLEEHAVGPSYGRMLPEAIATFEWAHMLHRQLYDIIADERLSPQERSERVDDAMRYYRSRPDLALSSASKSMDLMEGQSYSLAFRRAAPRFNRLIWSYHWLQMALYDAMLQSDDPRGRRDAVAQAIDRFFAMVGDSVGSAPTMMPMSAAVAPRFTALYPEAAIIFDNLHSLHDVVSDVLEAATVPPRNKRAEIEVALERYRDSTSSTMSRTAWLEMARSMGDEGLGAGRENVSRPQNPRTPLGCGSA
jgi:hypothetical protein